MKSTKCLPIHSARKGNKFDTIFQGMFFLMIISPMILASQINIDYNHFTRLYNSGEYQKLYDEAVAIRKKPYGKIWKIDYFISKALCASGYSDEAKKAFNYTLSAYKGNLDTKQFDFLMNERDACLTSVSSSSIPPTVISNMISVNTFASVSGKMGYVVNCHSEAGAFDADTAFNAEELEGRLFDLRDSVKAVGYYRSLLGSGYNIRSGGRYIFIVPKTKVLLDVSKVTQNLENAYNFYAENYEIRKPDKLIAVYLLGNEETLKLVAKKVHGMNLPARNIGYSCLADLSLLGTSSLYTIGTIYHELFHLMVRTDVGDIPGWLDEGVACLYETSEWENGILKGKVFQWRTEIFKGLMLPRLHSLLENNWDEFSIAPGVSACDVALNYALAKHFAIYLQEKDMLRKVVTAFKERKNVLVDISFRNETDIELLEKALNKSLKDIQADFDEWMDNTYHTTVNRTDGEASLLIDKTYFSENRDYFESKKQLLTEELVKVSGTGFLPDWYIDKLNSYLMEAKYSFNQ